MDTVILVLGNFVSHLRKEAMVVGEMMIEWFEIECWWELMSNQF